MSQGAARSGGAFLAGALATEPAPTPPFRRRGLGGNDGELYDVDFFLAGDPGAMRVTETAGHKINGQPLYTWAPKRDGTWRRVPVKKASQRQVGVVHGRGEFEFIYRVRLPPLSGPALLWLPLAQSDRFQTVHIEALHAPGAWKELADQMHGHKVLLLSAGPADSGRLIEVHCRVPWQEKWAYPAADAESVVPRYQQPERLVHLDPNSRSIAEQVTAGKESDLRRARALYDHVIERMR